jgi:hypothetical protein
VPLALTAHALTLVATAEVELGITTGTGGDRLVRLINSASDALAAACGRTFEYGATIAESVIGSGQRDLILSRAPVISVASVTIDGAALDISQIKIHDDWLVERPGGWPWTAHVIPDIRMQPSVGTERHSIVATYAGGYVTPAQVAGDLTRTLPYDLEEACLELVKARWFSAGRDPAVRSASTLSSSVSFGDPGTRFGDAGEWPGGVWHTIERYRRPF